LYSPKRNTQTLETVVKDHDESPFFMFMNYMDTHRPYKPEKAVQETHLGEVLDYKEILRLNEEVAYPWEFLSKLEKDSLSEEDVEKVRQLYAGEVETVDTHLQKIFRILEEADILDETLVVVTSDHGENLGERDERGNRRIGHEATVSEEVLHVPLLLAHPHLQSDTITEPVSLKDLYSLLLNASELIDSRGETIPGLLPYEGVVASQYPATGGQMFFERHPDVPEKIIHHRVSEHSAIAYDTDWKVIAESTGEHWAGKGGQQHPLSDAPELLADKTEHHLSELMRNSETKDISRGDMENLEALGYI
jgi:arylsulfatase A-like enzyme